MTGFGQAVAQSQNFIILIEIKSVNNRFKDVRFKMPPTLNSHEIELKNRITGIFSRGSFDVYVNLKRPENRSRFDDIDTSKVKQFILKTSSILKEEGIVPTFSMTDLLRSEFLLEQEDSHHEEINSLLFESFEKAIVELKKARELEGAKLIKVLENHLEEFRRYFNLIEKNAENFKQNVEEKLKKRAIEYKETILIEPNRLLQEIVFYLEKIDIHEEINRIHSHLEKFKSLLKSDKDVGRQIDFLIQEMGRETNTIGSKSGMKETSAAVMEMKLQLEKMREQGLNIE